MSGPELRYRQAALADLEDIYRGVLRVSASPVTAQRYLARIIACIQRISVLPQAAGRATTSRPACAPSPSSAAS